MALHTNQDITEEEMRQAFRVFDKDENGNIPEGEMRSVLTSLGVDLPDDELDELILEGDADGNGSFDFKGFYLI